MADEIEQVEMTDEELLKRLLGMDSKPPERRLVIKRGDVQIPITIRALRDDEIERLREQCSHEVKDRKGRVRQEIDQIKLYRRLVVEATVKPNWGAPELLEKYKASGPDEVVRRILLAGEIDGIVNEISSLSGFEEGVEEVKN